MEEKVKIERLILHVKEYAEERLNLIILNLLDKVSRVMSVTASFLLMAVLSLVALLFLSLALAWWIGSLLQQPYLGFLIVAGIYLLALLLIYANRNRWIRKPVIDAFLKQAGYEED